MIQSHLLLVMAIFAMEEPANIDALELRDLMVHSLRATKVWSGEGEVPSRRARYTAGSIDGREVPDYTAEEGVDASRNTETLAQVTVEICNARWAGGRGWWMRWRRRASAARAASTRRRAPCWA